MDGGATAGGSVAGPAPFLLKTYEMIDDSKTDRIVSWSGNRNSFVVWDPPEFQRLLLPSYFKHRNFSSFIRQLNTYGFRKIDSEKWEFANEEFAKGQKHLLKNIHRRKPIHSHSQPQGSTDPERAAFEEEIDKLTREKSELEGNISGYKQQNSAAKEQLKSITDVVLSMEQRQEKLLAFMEKASQNPKFVERLVQKLESMDFSAYNKKRKLPLPRVEDNSQSVQENVLVNSQNSSRSEFGNVFEQDASDKLRVEITASTQNSDEDGIITPEGRIEGLWSKEAQVRTQSFFSPPDTLELSDTGTSLTANMDRSEIQKPLTPDKEGDISCILDLTLASSSPLQLNKNQDSIGIGANVDDIPQRPTLEEANVNDVPQRPILKEANVDTHEDHHNKKQENNGFWAHFLTEMPGSPDNNNEEANSSFRANHRS